MRKLPYVLLFVTLSLVLLNIVVLRQLGRVEDRLSALEKRVPATP